MLRSGLFCAMLALACGPDVARAGFDVTVTGSATKQADSTYLYSYIVINQADSTLSVSEFDIAVNDPIGVTTIKSPSDFFQFYTPGDSFISFYATDSGIAPGSAGVFSFISMSAPGMVADLARGLDSSTFTTADAPGMVIGAAITPEPSSLLMCALGAFGPLGLYARSRWRRSA